MKNMERISRKNLFSLKKLNPPSSRFRRTRKLNQVIISTIIISVVVSLLIGFSAGALGGYLFGKTQGQKLIQKFEELIPSKESSKSPSGEDVVPKYESSVSHEQEVINVVKNASPAVVSIIITKDLPVIERYYENPFEEFEQFFGDDFFSPFEFQVPQYRQKGTEKREIRGGTGFIVSEDGLVVTNKHVVSDSEAEYTVLTNEGEKYDAEVLARDPMQDLAVLKVKKPGFPTLKLGDSDGLQIGQTVVAIGNALGEFRNTVSVGVISGLRRTITASGGGMSETIEEVIQTDAAINQGNSGGPLLNLKGEVIGINTAMAMGAENIGFAIPVNKAKKDIQQVSEKGKISYPFLGVRYILLNKQIQEVNKLPVDYGTLIVRGQQPGEVAVMPGSAADKAGLQENDITLEMDGVKIDQENSLAKLIQKHNVGDEVILKVLSKGEEKMVKAVLGENE